MNYLCHSLDLSCAGCNPPATHTHKRTGTGGWQGRTGAQTHTLRRQTEHRKDWSGCTRSRQVQSRTKTVACPACTDTHTHHPGEHDGVPVRQGADLQQREEGAEDVVEVPAGVQPRRRAKDAVGVGGDAAALRLRMGRGGGKLAGGGERGQRCIGSGGDLPPQW